ncbi:23S rRNA pseudouridine2605 synthase [Longispora fulva]|uniref:Pseudouridine synthase n=2 Tax=Longispora fulva TaxID=619741 RepID=A0A8J7KFJ6_9ACTN|nr:23S rRNA pseudouridine2605 synthase [Longispora fulva]
MTSPNPRRSPAGKSAKPASGTPRKATTGGAAAGRTGTGKATTGGAGKTGTGKAATGRAGTAKPAAGKAPKPVKGTKPAPGKAAGTGTWQPPAKPRARREEPGAVSRDGVSQRDAVSALGRIGGPDTRAGRGNSAGRAKTPIADMTGAERLQKVLAASGIGSRRDCENLISEGRVMLNGQVAKLGDKADPETAEIYVDGERLVTDTRLVYLAMNKPLGVMSTMSDEKGRISLAEYVGRVAQRVYHVGRLDAETEGLLLLTNDGDLAHKLTHPSFEVSKTYLAEVSGTIPQGFKKRIMTGIELEDGFAKADSFKVVTSAGGRTLVELSLHEGRKHIVRRLLGEMGHEVHRLVRVSIGPIHLGDTKPGRIRKLGQPEIAALFKAVEQ